MTLALLITAVGGAWAQGPWTSGECTVTLNNGTLTVSGNGTMDNYANLSDRPWDDNKGDITSVVVESGVTSVGMAAFIDFSTMTSVTLPEGLTAIGAGAFYSCSSLQSISIPSTVTSIGASAFWDCSAITSVTLPEGLTTIEPMAFSSCSSLTSITIPSTVTSIGDLAFMSSSAISDVNLYANPDNLTWGSTDWSFKESKATQCHVLAEHLSTYQNKFSSANVSFVGDLQPLATSDVEVTTNAAEEGATFTEAWFNMPTNDVTADYELVRDMQDEANPVAFSGLPSSGNIVVKKGDDGKYQPAEALTIQLIDPLAAAEAQNIIQADGITVKVGEMVPFDIEGSTYYQLDKETLVPLADFLADMKPGLYKMVAEPTDENSPYDGTVYSSQFTAVEKYDLTVKPANDFSKGKIESVTVGSGSVTIDANGKASKTGLDPDTEVKIKAKRGYVIDKVEAKKIVPAEGHDLTASAVGDIVGSDGKTYAAADKDNLPKNVTAVAMVAYKNGTGGLAIALSDEGSMNFSTAKSTCESKTAISGATWQLPSKNQWEQIFSANGGNNNSWTGLNTAIDNAGGTALVAGNVYWSTSSGPVSGSHYCMMINNDGSIGSQIGSSGKNKMTRAILTF